MPSPGSENNQTEWKHRIEQQRQSSLSIEKWCRQNQVRPHAFHYWKRRIFSKPLQRTSFEELHIKRPDAILLQACGIYIRIGSDCDLNLRKQIFALFAEASC